MEFKEVDHGETCHLGHELKPTTLSKDGIKPTCGYCCRRLTDSNLMHCDDCQLSACKDCLPLSKDKKLKKKHACDIYDLIQANKTSECLLQLIKHLSHKLDELDELDDQDNKKNKGKYDEDYKDGDDHDDELDVLDLIYNIWKHQEELKTLLMAATVRGNHDIITALIATKVMSCLCVFLVFLVFLIFFFIVFIFLIFLIFLVFCFAFGNFFIAFSFFLLFFCVVVYFMNKTHEFGAKTTKQTNNNKKKQI